MRTRVGRVWHQPRPPQLSGWACASTWARAVTCRRYATIWFNSGSTADTRARELVQRYGLLAHMLLYKDARGQMGLEDAIGKGILLPEEAIVLTPLPSRSQMVFTWLMDFWSRATSPNPNPTPGVLDPTSESAPTSPTDRSWDGCR